MGVIGILELKIFVVCDWVGDEDDRQWGRRKGEEKEEKRETKLHFVVILNYHYLSFISGVEFLRLMTKWLKFWSFLKTYIIKINFLKDRQSK